MTGLSDLAEEVVHLVEKSGGEICDVLIVDMWATTAEVERNSVKQAEYTVDPGLAVRVYEGGSSGFAYCTSHEKQDIEKAAELAVSQARAGTPDSDFRGLPEVSPCQSIDCLYDPILASLEPEKAIDMLLLLVDAASDDARVASVNAGLTVSASEIALANSNGLVRSQRMTSFDVFAEAVARSGDSMFSGMDYASSRRLLSDSTVAVGESAKQQAISGLKQTKMETGDFPVVLDPLAAGYILASSIGGGANAEGVQRKRSYLAGRLGTTVGSEILTILDDPTLGWAVGSTSFDGEGVAAKRKAVIEKGELKTYLHDTYTAGKDSVETTGNSSRGGAIWSYWDPPAISFSNLVVRCGDASLDEMIRECDKGVYLRVTFDSPNLATGEFSGLLMEGYAIEKGEVGPAVQQATMGIDMLDMFARVDIIGKQQRYAFGVETPALRISSARIGGSG
ncbi:MAG: TldD/PmbA family protein [Methanobacteriota archaeon]|nr:MAG: TldD/PmbA family protein [Euryarchaeota archaeon]